MEDHQLQQEDMGDQEEDQEDQGRPRQEHLELLGEQELQVWNKREILICNLNYII